MTPAGSHGCPGLSEAQRCYILGHTTYVNILSWLSLAPMPLPPRILLSPGASSGASATAFVVAVAVDDLDDDGVALVAGAATATDVSVVVVVVVVAATTPP